MKNNKKAFTLIELLVATTIIAVLIAIGTVSYSSVSRKSRDTKRRSDVEQIRAALEMYRADIGSYPFLELELVDSSYIPKIPVGPKSDVYFYTPTNVASGVYYGYTVQSTLEGYTAPTVAPENTCTPTGTYNYCMKNP
jgi:general secretion pathway protein G